MTERYQVPVGVDIATQWAWRIVVLAAAGAIGIFLLRFFSELTIPVAIALLISALLVGAVDWLEAHRIPRLFATFLVVIAGLAVVIGMLALVGQQLSTQVGDLRSNVVEGLTQVQDWLKNGPLNLSQSQIQTAIDKAKNSISSGGASTVGHVGVTVTHILAGFFITLFSTFFFLFEGERIWAWIVALFPKAARERVNSSGHTAWASLTAFVRATMLVALTDAIGIALGAWILGVPLALAIGVLVFIGAFIPVIGALLSGLVAVLVAMVAQGPFVALAMLGVVVAIQQLESHVLQPFLMGRLVAVHPLAIILAIAAGVTVGGVVGALIAVPLAASLNGVVRHLVEVARDYEEDPEPKPA